MKKENNELTDLFRFRLGESEMQVRKGFWEDIEREIPVILSRRRQLIHRFVAAASVLLVLGGVSAALWYFSPKEEIANAFTQLAVTTGTGGQINADIVHQEFPVFQASSTSPIPPSLEPAGEVEEYPDTESFSISVSMSVSMSVSYSSSSANADQNDRSDVEYNGQNSLAGQFDNASSKKTSSGANDVAAGPAPEKKHKKWSTGIHAAAGLLNDRILAQNAKPFVTNDMTNGFLSGITKHKLPFSAGISIRRELSDTWGIESGLTYTLLNSELATGENIRYTQNQTLHYVGIPVKVDYSLYKNNRMKLYASAGGMVEKCVKGRVKTEAYSSGYKMRTVVQSITPDPLQLSLYAAVGLQYNVCNRLSLYAEPGLSYHFDDGSSVASIRKENPLNISLLCGVRMTY